MLHNFSSWCVAQTPSVALEVPIPEETSNLIRSKLILCHRLPRHCQLASRYNGQGQCCSSIFSSGTSWPCSRESGRSRQSSRHSPRYLDARKLREKYAAQSRKEVWKDR
ncbi:uncharacterized protein RCO7_14747 [Rhynchosporium graminicola]|uniref:Uncharacterized protein n=1 Tax=Rhynchosporium graminicola TaxID=2792576 RepID=A0A1E1L074_9HELO|nr:uncharacterized protein RCO7_14747 [Rhynchosporium commune]